MPKSQLLFSAVFGFRNPSKEIFSELDEINTQGPIFPRSFQKTERITKWGAEAPRRHGPAGQGGAPPPSCWGPLPAPRLCPSAYLKPSSRNPQYREPRYGKPSRDAAAANPISGILEISSGTLPGRGFISRRTLRRHGRLRSDV